jgi:hypothetical protein
MKIQLELNVAGRATFLNFWDSNHGKDVVCQLVSGRLIRHKGQPNEKEMTIAQFIKAVKKSAMDEES